jgi:hypothetical protein
VGLEVLLASPPPPPPANVPLLEETKGSEGLRQLTVRERMEEHRKNPACASCHRLMDPIGLSTENFDAIGRWRDKDNGKPVDSAGVLTTGERFSGPQELKAVLLARKEQFAQVLARKTLAFALGRSLRYYDEPVVEKIARAVVVSDWRPASLLLAVAESYPFQFQQSNPSQEHTE